MAKEKSATTLRLSEERRSIRAIAGYGTGLSTIFEEMAGEYIERHSETLALLGYRALSRSAGKVRKSNGKGKISH